MIKCISFKLFSILCVLLMSSLALAQSQTQASERFGVCTHIVNWQHAAKLDFVRVIEQAGLWSFRDEQGWNHVEKSPGVYQFSKGTEQMIDRANELGIEPLFLLVYGAPKGMYENPLDPEAFGNCAAHAVTHFKGRIKYFEIWNEPHNFFFRQQYGGAWNGKEADNSDALWVKKFAEFVEIVARKIKQANPDVFLVTGAIDPVNHRLLARYPAMWEHIDAMAIHPYPYSLPPELTPFGGKNNERDGVFVADDSHSFSSMIQTYRKAIETMGKPQMQIWITEVGYTTARQTKKQLFQGFTPYAQACYNVRMGLLAAGNGVEKTYFYDLFDDGNEPDQTEHHFGLFNRDSTPKPAWMAISRMAGLMPGNTLPTEMKIDLQIPTLRDYHVGVAWDDAKIKYINQPQIQCFLRPDGQRVVFIWKPGRIFADAQDDIAHVTIKDCPYQLLEAGHLVTGRKLQLQSTHKDNTLVINGMPYTEDPVYFLLK